jgi:hypothetical protein
LIGGTLGETERTEDEDDHEYEYEDEDEDERTIKDSKNLLQQ